MLNFTEEERAVYPGDLQMPEELGHPDDLSFLELCALNRSYPFCQALCTLNATANDSGCTLDSFMEYHPPYTLQKASTLRIVLFWMNVYLTPVLIVVGTLGNVLSCVVLLSDHLRRQSSSVYLACLSIADTGFLLSLLVAWLAWVHVDLFNRQGWCQLTVFLAYVSAFLSVWSVVSFTAERYIAVWHPFHRHIVCSARRARVLVVVLTVLGVLIYSPSLWTSTVLNMYGSRVCAPDPDLIHVANALMNVDTVITLVIPALLIIPLNIAIVSKIYRTLQEHASLHEEQHRPADRTSSQSARARTPSHSQSPSATPRDSLDQPDFPSSNNNRHKGGCGAGRGLKRSGTCRNSQCKRHSEGSLSRRGTTTAALQRRNTSQMKTTRTLVFISSIFVLLNAPSHAFRIHAFIVSLRGAAYRASDSSLRGQEAAQLIYYVNYAINFFLYSACAQRFRKTLKCMLRRMRYSLSCSRDRGGTGDCCPGCLGAPCQEARRMVSRKKSTFKLVHTGARSLQRHTAL